MIEYRERLLGLRRVLRKCGKLGLVGWTHRHPQADMRTSPMQISTTHCPTYFHAFVGEWSVILSSIVGVHLLANHV